MQSESNYRTKNFVATLCVCVAMIVIGYLAVTGVLRSYLFELLLLVAVLLTWLVNRAIPFRQILLLFAAIIAVNWLLGEVSELFPPISLLSDKVMDLLLIGGFGAYWVHKGYIPVHRNMK